MLDRISDGMPHDVRVSMIVGFATGRVARQADCELIEAFDRLQAHARTLGQTLEATALDVLDGEVGFQPPAHPAPTVSLMATCPGALIQHVGGTVAGCTLDELDGAGECLGLELRHEGDPKLCWQEHSGCDLCGIHEPS